MVLASGAQIGPYKIGEEIGSGGMGVVYRASDTNLKRDVAIKALPESLASDAERLARFRREAEVLASLNHPNIAQIYGLEKADGTTGLIMELVEGPTLADRVAKGPLQPDEALGIAMQIADALETAHSQNIVHRDLKPANIKLRQDGTVKVLDFGIAKALEPESIRAEPQSPMLTTPATQVGVILGTAAYMSPEQAKGQPVDQRADIWAFGCVLYEMLTGQLAFGAEDVPTTLARVIANDTNLSSLPATISPAVRQTISLCLEKDLKKRVADIRDVKLALEGAFESGAPQAVEETAVRPLIARRVLPIAAALAIGGVVAGLAAWSLKPEAPGAVIRLVQELPETQTFTSTFQNVMAISPDGTRVVYVANLQLYLRELSEWEAQPIVGTDNQLPTGPMFSPDGQWIGYFSRRDQQLKKVAATGGVPVVLTETDEPLGHISWANDDTILWGQADGVRRVSANGGTPEMLAEVSDLASSPQLLPDGDTLLFRVGGSTEPQVIVQSLRSGERKTLLEGLAPRYLPTGHLVYGLDRAIYAVPFDLATLETIGGAVPVVIGVNPTQYVVSDAGALAYVSSLGSSRERVLGLASRDGVVERLSVPIKEYLNPRLSPDGRTLVVESAESTGNVIWRYDLNGDRAIQQLTFEGDNQRPSWTPDGRRITFSSDRDGTMSLYWMPADGSGVAERLTTAESGTSHWMGSWLPDGETLLFNIQRSLASDWDIATLSLADHEIRILYDTPRSMYVGHEISPDGQWLAYSAGPNSAALDVYVEPFPPLGARHRISQNGGYFPVWSPQGDELFYRPVSTTAAITLRSVDIVTEPGFTFSNPQTLPIEGFDIVAYHRDYDISPDGEFLMVFPDQVSDTARPRINIVLNWINELEERVPTE